MQAYKIYEPDEARAIAASVEDWAPANSNTANKNNEESTDDALVEGIGLRILGSPIIQAHFVESISPPKLNRYRDGGEYGSHTDAAKQFGVRSDLACTLFLTDDYEGGELQIGKDQIKLPAGHALVYECWKPHEVRPVTKGERIAAIFWLQSYIRSEEQRELLNRLRQVIVETEGEHFAQLGSIHERLVKMWWS